MNDWKNVQLGSLIDYKKGYAFKSKYYDSDGDNIIVRVSDTTIDSINISTCHKIKSEYVNGLDDYRLQTDDVIIATVGSWADNPQSIVGKVVKVPVAANGSLLNQNAVRLRAKNLLDQKYLFYSLRDNIFSSYLLNSAQGSANQASITLNDIFGYTAKLPPLPEQKAIADVLSALDDKIDLLQRQNETLEKMAETLFRQWFIEEAKEDWEEDSLGNHINTYNGVSYKSEELKSSKIALVTLKNFARSGGLREDGFKEFTGSYKEQHIVIDGDIIVAHTDLTQNADLIGNPLYVRNIHQYEKLIISMDLVKVELSSQVITKSFLFYLLKSSEFKDFALANSNGSSVIHLSKKALPTFKFKYPKKDLNKIKEFTNIALPIDKKVFNNLSQIQTLQNLRDTLLPKLMSGEVRVKLD